MAAAAPAPSLKLATCALCGHEIRVEDTSALYGHNFEDDRKHMCGKCKRELDAKIAAGLGSERENRLKELEDQINTLQSSSMQTIQWYKEKCSQLQDQIDQLTEENTQLKDTIQALNE
jgi:hypothetical protein